MRTVLPLLLKVHRWIALILSPVFLLVILSGAVLAFKPVVDAGERVAIDPATLVSSLAFADPQGKAGTLSVAADGKTFTLQSRGTGPTGVFDLASGERVGKVGFDLFNFMRRLHENLFIGAGWLVTLAAVAMSVLIVSGLFFGWRKPRNTLSGWHAGFGWLTWPLMALTPLTGLLMAFHLGMPGLPRMASAEKSLPIAQVIAIASKQADLSQLGMARNFRRGSVMLSAQDENGDATQYLVSGDGQVVKTQGEGWVRMLHQGTWAGAFSGVLTFLSTIPLFGLLYTGVLAWWRRFRYMGSRGGVAPSPTTVMNTKA